MPRFRPFQYGTEGHASLAALRCIPNCQVRRELERFGEVSDISRDHIREKGFERVESNTRLLQMTLKDGTTVDDIPHELKVKDCKVLVVVPGRAPLCLRCRKTGHIGRDFQIPRCTERHRYGHVGEDCVRTFAAIVR